MTQDQQTAARRLRAEWYRKGLHDPKSQPAKDLRTSVAHFGRELFAALDEIEDET